MLSEIRSKRYEVASSQASIALLSLTLGVNCGACPGQFWHRFIFCLHASLLVCSDQYQDRLHAGLCLWFYAPNKDKKYHCSNQRKRLCLWMENWFQNWCIFQRIMHFERQAASFTFSEFFFSRRVFFQINLGLSRLTFCCGLSLVLCAKKGQKYHRSIQHGKLYLAIWMANVLLNNSILTIYGLWKSSEIV
jgi:hypothetical protein